MDNNNQQDQVPGASSAQTPVDGGDQPMTPSSTDGGDQSVPQAPLEVPAVTPPETPVSPVSEPVTDNPVAVDPPVGEPVTPVTPTDGQVPPVVEAASKTQTPWS